MKPYFRKHEGNSVNMIRIFQKMSRVLFNLLSGGSFFPKIPFSQNWGESPPTFADNKLTLADRIAAFLWRNRAVQSKTLFENRPSTGEISSDVLENVKEIYAESNLEIPDSNLDRAHRIGKSYFDKIKKVKCKSIIVRFNTFRHRTLLYRTKKDIKQKKG